MSKEENKKLILIDSHALIHRAFHALPPLTTKKGELVNAVYGFVLVLLKVLRELKPDYVMAAFDLAGPTFRHKEFQDYKATRKKAPDELYQQIGRVKEVVKAFNIPIHEKAGYEADDIIGSLAGSIKNEPGKNKKKIKKIIVTGDLDTLQLIDEDTSVFTLKKGVKDTILYDKQAVQDRYGLEPGQMPDFKGLKGDPSDNIPGVPGVGEKTAIELLKKYGSIEELYKELEKNKKLSKDKSGNDKIKFFEKLSAFKDQAFFSKYLATIKKDIKLKIDWKKSQADYYDQKKVSDLFKELNFFSLIDRLPESSVVSGKQARQEKLNISGPPGVFEKIEEARAAGILSDKVYKIEKELVPVIESMQQNGIKVDLKRLERLNKEFSSRLLELEEKIHQLSGLEFNINSPSQLSEVLFEKLKLGTKGLKKTPGRVLSTAAPELNKLKGQHQIVDLILEYRELAKLKSTYAESIPKLISVSDQRIHTQFDQMGTSTGRLSSRNPNLQNIPIKTELGNEIRKAFVADPGFLFVAADYSQLELRVVASLAQDDKMIKILKEGEDIHRATAAEVFEVSLEDVTAKMRQSAKALNFGVIYGMSMHGFAQAAGIDYEKAKIFIKKYFEEFKGVAFYLEKIKKEVAQNGFVQTLFGRKRFLPEINSSAWNLRQAAERAAVNFPIQGTAADLMKMAMIDVFLKFKNQGQRFKILLQVHDELVFEISKDYVKESAADVKKLMESVYVLPAPLKVKIETGENWGELRGFEF